MKKNSGITMREGFDCGFAITTTGGYEIKENASDRGIELTDAQWETINDDIAKIERNVMQGLAKKYGIIFRDEGHDNTDDLIGTCWIDLGKHWDYVEQQIEGTDRQWLAPKQAKAYQLLIETQGQDVAIDMLTSYGGDLPKCYYRCSNITKDLVDVYVHFFNVDEADADKFSEETEALHQALNR